MVGAEVLRHLARVARLVERALGKTNREALHVAPELRHHGGHRAGVDPPGQEHAERDVADELLANRLTQHPAQLLAPFVEVGAARSLSILAERRGPITMKPVD